MRFIVMHKTNARREAGAVPGRELIERVGRLIGEMAEANVLLAGEGLRPSSEGVRVRFVGGARSVSQGPFEGENELPAAFTILKAASLGEAVEWASRQAEVLGDGEVDVRPVTEAWDIGLVPPPENVETRRFMALRKATAASEAETAPSAEQRARMARLIEETTRAGKHLATETFKSSRRGRRYRNAQDGLSVTDGPFTESKELIAGYVILSVDSLESAHDWALRYLEAVEAEEVDLCELEGPG